MKNPLYLLSVGVSGIKNIKEEVHLNFYKKTVDKDFDPEKYRVKAIYGENGAGKSALITAIKIVRDLIVNDNYLNDSKTQIFLDEIINKTTHSFRFNCEFLITSNNQSRVFQYIVHIEKNKNGIYEIQQERLQVKNGNYTNNKYKTVFESKQGELIDVNCADCERERIEKKSINLLSSHSFIDLYFLNFEEEDLTNEEEGLIEAEFLLGVVTCMLLFLSIKVYLAEEDQHELYFWQKKMRERGLDNQVLVSRLLEGEDSINAFSNVNERLVDKKYFEQYKERVKQLTQFIKIFKSDLVSIDIDAKENGEQYVCDLNLNYGDYVINKEFESTGIKKLIRLFDCFSAASANGIVFIDEMDSNLNDVYLCKLIEYFMYYGKGQLCFTTHNLDPMTVLKDGRNSIDFLSSDNHLVSWTSRGNATPENCYKNGMIEDSPFNIDATDFVGIFGE